MPSLFTSPTTADLPRPPDRLFRFVRQPSRGRHVVRTTGGVWQTVDSLTAATEATLSMVLYGGHQTTVSDAHAAELTAAGYGAYLTSSLLAEAAVLFRASSFTGIPGDNWRNEGTAGRLYDAIATGTPQLDIVYPGAGFVLGGIENVGPYYHCPDGSAIEPGTGSFTAFARFRWTHATGSFDNIASKINTDAGVMGSGGRGWQLAAGSAVGGGAAAVIADGAAALTAQDPAAALAQAEHLLAMRLDRGANQLSLFVDGVKVSTTDVSTVPSVAAAHEWIIGRNSALIARAWGFWHRALTDTEITVTLPADLGVLA